MTSDRLILHGGALGDLVLTLQLALRLERGGTARPAQLRVVSRANPGDLSTCQPGVQWQSSEGLGLHWLFGDHDDPPPQRLEKLVREQHVLSALGGPHTIVHHRLDELRPATLYSFDPQPHAGLQRHITEQWQTQLEAQGLLVPKCVHQRPAQRGLGVPDTLRQRGHAILTTARCNENTVLIHPGSGGRRKCWPLTSFIDVAHQWSNTGVAVCFLLGPAEAETWNASDCHALTEAFPVLAGPQPDDLAAVLSAARALLGNDAGPSHLAALLGTPTIVLFGATPASVWRPLGPSVRVLSGSDATRPDWGIEPAHVLDAVRAARFAHRAASP